MYNKLSEYYILLGESYFNVTNYRMAEGYLLTAIDNIENEKNLNEDERNYLKYFVYNFLYLTYNRLFDNIKRDQCIKIIKNISYNNENVRNYIYTHFPIDRLLRSQKLK